ncbi:MAG: Ig-like domain-containing protein [Pseudomonadota bacterium]
MARRRLAGTNRDDALVGSGQDDRIVARDGNDWIWGNGGSDLIYGGANRDRLIGGGSDDRVIGGKGADRLFGNFGNDALSGNKGHDVGYGGDGNDRLSGGKGDDTLNGEAGDDTIAGGSGNDRLSGGSGSDSLSGGSGNDRLAGHGGRDTLSGNGGNDRLFGDNGRDTLSGNKGNDSLMGGADDDVLSGGAGNDVVMGDGGDDTINAGSGRDQVFGGSGDDKIEGGSGSDALMGEGGRDEILGGDGRDDLMGGRGRDRLEGGSGADTVSGDDGDDRLFGNGGNDLLIGGQGDDFLDGGAGANVLRGGSDDDTFIHTARKNGNDQIFGGSGTDTLCIELTAAEANDPAIIAELRLLNAALEAGVKQLFFRTLNIDATGIERLKVVVGDSKIDLSNRDPIAVDDTLTGIGIEDRTIDIPVVELLLNDREPDGDPLTITDISVNPDLGTVFFNPTTVFFRFVPAENVTGPVEIAYTVADGVGGSDSAILTITLAPVNDDPVAGDDDLQASAGQTIIVPFAVFLDNDGDVDGDILTITDVTNPGTLADVALDTLAETVTITLDPAATGTLSFDYTVSDGQTGSDSATVTIEALAPTTAAPSVLTRNIVFKDDMNEVIGDDYDTFVLVDGPDNGTLTLSDDGSFVFTPDRDFTGTDSFTFTAESDQGIIEVFEHDLYVDPQLLGLHMLFNNDAIINGTDTDLDSQNVHLTDASKLGAEVIRYPGDWRQLQPDGPDSFDQGYVDLVLEGLRTAEEGGMKVVMLFAQTADWAAPDGIPLPQSIWHPPEDPQAYADAVAYLAQEVKDAGLDDVVIGWEIWNEPNVDQFWTDDIPMRTNPNDPNDEAFVLLDAAQAAPGYVELLNAAYDALKAVDSDITVVGGSLAGTDIDYLEQMTALGAKYDVLGLHPYTRPDASNDGLPYRPGDPINSSDWLSEFWNFKEGVEQIRAHLVDVEAGSSPAKDIWFTEFGWDSGDDWGDTGGDAEQAAYYQEAFAIMEDWDFVTVATAYRLYDDVGAGEFGDLLGMLTEDRERKDVADVFEDQAALDDAIFTPIELDYLLV